MHDTAMTLNVKDLNNRSLEIFRELVDTYVETGEPVGSRTLSRRLSVSLSPATIRNIMADLEEAGLLYAPHTSAGRLPTEEGLRFFVHGLLQIGSLSDVEMREIEGHCEVKGRSVTEVLEQATATLSGLTKCVGLVMAPKTESPLKHIEFVNLGIGRALAVIITEDGLVENRVMELPLGLPASILIEASNYLNARLIGKTLTEARAIIHNELVKDRNQINTIASDIVEQGVAVWAGGDHTGSLIVKGQAHLLENVTVFEQLNQIRDLFQALDTKESLISLLDASIKGDGVQIFIGAENNLFNHSGCSLVVAPYHNSSEKIIGAIGVIGPSRMNYGKIIPLVDYTAKIVGRLLG
jgi:heat-inducible transcriptional repressor